MTLTEMIIQEAKAEGREEGEAKGREEGEAKGREKGREEGRAESNVKNTLKLFSKGMKIHEISEILEISIEEVKEIIEKNNDSLTILV